MTTSKFIFSILFVLFSDKMKAQYLSLSALDQIQFISDYSSFEIDPLSAYGAELNYSNNFIFTLNYNVGTEFLIADESNMALLKTGISKIYLAPSSFNKAKNKESVSYSKNNWLSSLDLNIYNGYLFSSTDAYYIFAAEPAWNVFFMIGKKKRFFIGGELALRYTLFPSENTSTFNFPVQLGLKYEI